MALIAQIVRFGPFQLDLRAAELHHNGSRTKLPEQPFQVLTALLEHPGDVVTREELRQRLWGSDTFVDYEQGLNTAVRRLREILGDSADKPQYVETVPRHGYRLMVEVGAPAPGSANQKFLARQPKIWLGAAALLIILAGAGLAWRSRLLHPFQPRKIDSLAVLPLENLSDDPKAEYFADGMTEALITELGKVHALRVISRHSILQYKGTNKPVPQIARELRVDAVVEGSALRVADRVRITVQLMQARPERHLWSESYERPLQDVLTLQTEVARAITQQIQITVTPEEQERLAKLRPVNPQAYEAYLKGSYALHRVGGRPVTGIDYFREAIAKDPAYGPPYVGLCVAYIQMGFGHGPLPPSRALAETRIAAEQALKLDDNLTDAYACLAWVKTFSDWDWRGGESAFQRTIRLNPNSVQAHRLYSWYLSATERHTEAIAESQLARKLDPESLATGYTAAASHWWARQIQSCSTETQNLERMDETYPGAQHLLGSIAFVTGSYEEAIRRYQRAVALSGEKLPVWTSAHLGCAYTRSGNRAEALRIADQLGSASNRTYVTPYALAYLQGCLGNTDQAFRWLDKAYEERNPMLAFLKVDPILDPLRSDPRFQELVRKMNFPD